jgi:Xaa-Pro aminopeptidase
MAFLSRAVFAERLDAMRALMEREQVDALLFTTGDYCFYASNWELDVLTWERPALLGVTRDGRSFAVLHELSSHHVAMAREQGRVWLEDVSFYTEVVHKGATLPHDAEFPLLVARVLGEHGLAGSRVGVDAARGFLAGSNVEIVPLEQELRELRLVLSGEELELARRAASLADWGQERYREAARPGRYVEELDWSIGAQIMQEAGDRWPGESVKIRLLSLSGPASAAPHGDGASTGARISAGDVLVNIIVLRLNGVTIENERTWLIGEPTPEQARAFDAAVDAQSAAIAELTTGRPVRAAHEAATAVFVERGFGDNVIHRTGHGMGIGHGAALTAHDFPHDTATSDRPLRAGELYSVEPGIYLPGLGGFRHDDSVVVGEQPEVLTTTPRDRASQTLPV